MSGVKDVFKGGWHPKGKDGGKESWRGDFKGVNQAGWMGKGKDSSQAAYEHQSAPLSTLKDPASFGPPPKHVKYHGAAAASASTARPAGSSSSNDGGIGSPVQGPTRQRLQESQVAKVREGEEADNASSGPFRADTTGLSTAHLPKPPAFRPGLVPSSPTKTTEAAKPKPRLPPRLPPRQNSHPDTYAPSPPPTYNEATQEDSSSQGIHNQGTLNRLGTAGISVPGLNIGRNASPPVPPRQNTASSGAPDSPAAEANRGPQLSELQSRFAKMSSLSSGTQAPATGTSWADKQAALKTAGSIGNNPSKVSMSDVRAAASTANNFRERHGEQAAAGWRAASEHNQKYGIGDRINTASSSASHTPQSPTHGSVRKKPPPPPPKRKDANTTPREPPPIPLSSKPKF